MEDEDAYHPLDDEDDDIRPPQRKRLKVTRREYAVLVKGVPAGPLKAAQNLFQELQDINGKAITRAKPMFRKETGNPRASLVVHLNDVGAAKVLCDEGLIWEAQIFHCEPYATELQFRQCYKCYGLGHIARYCSKQARCGCCAGVAHRDGEASCPQKGPNGKKKCVNCGVGQPDPRVQIDGTERPQHPRWGLQPPPPLLGQRGQGVPGGRGPAGAR
ncbi:hypothetical protein GE09DRAFT_1263135 [Coniochaeta sp. 2T2.1]|nr:hypothetical protein GE09DRAFT_1263135 [Coniochaeta sp. 2T2.1]